MDALFSGHHQVFDTHDKGYVTTAFIIHEILFKLHVLSLYWKMNTSTNTLCSFQNIFLHYKC